MEKALLIVDLQHDFVPGGALPVPGGDQVLSVANRIQEHFDLVVASQDWHPPDHGSFAENHPGRAPADVVTLGGLPQTLWPAHCVQGTRGAELLEDLDRSLIERVFRKGTDPGLDSYSAFFDNAHRRATGLDAFLRSRQITDLYVMGLATDYCVKFTALDARTLGYRTHLLLDGCRGVGLGEGDVADAVEAMREAGVKVTCSTDLIAPEP